MRRIFLLVLLAIGLVKCQNVSKRTLEKMERHLKKTPRTRTASKFVDKFTSDMDKEEKFKSILQNVLVVRVPDTKGSKRVQKYLKSHMGTMGWTITEDKFTDITPLGRKEFTNIIATLNPNAPRRLIIACHYDSKLTPSGFLGATDSAVPCTQMLHLATVMKKDLEQFKQSKLGHDLTLEFLFFDGEEAFVRWQGNDNTYGSRHLAKVWEENGLLPGIEMFMLLDLLGARKPKISPLDPNAQEWWKKLIEYENLVLHHDKSLPKSKIFQDVEPGLIDPPIGDDHMPFFQRGVPILHLIAYPFPDVWHTMADDRKIVHMPTVKKINRILRLFVAHYLNLGVDEEIRTLNQTPQKKFTPKWI